jgi:hypothetical protein
MTETQFYKEIDKNTWPDDIPSKNQFQGSDLTVQTPRWEYHRGPGSGGDNEAQDFKVPDDHVLVGWNANETSCIGCSGQAFQLVMIETGTRTFPIGIRTGARLEPGGLGGSGAYFTGDLSLISVPRSVWNRVADSIP